MPTNKRLKVDNRQKTLTQTGFLSKGNIEEPTKKGDDALTTETNQPTDTETNEHKKICNAALLKWKVSKDRRIYELKKLK